MRISLAALRELLVTQRNHNWQQRFNEHLLDVVHEQRLQRARSLREDRTRWIARLEILGDGIRVGQDLGSGWVQCWVHYDG